MFSVSPSYNTQINKSLRNISYMRVNIGIVESDAMSQSVITDNQHLFYSDTESVDTGANIEKRYLTFEHNKFILDGNNLLPPETGSDTPYYQGFVGTTISDSTGTFTTVPTVTITFPNFFSFLGLTFRFNKIFNAYPTEMEVVAYNGATQVYSSIQHPTSYDFVLDEPIPATGFCNKIELRFKKSFPVYRRAELSYIMFGIVATYTDEDITNATWSREIDLISTKLPKNEFSFTIIDPLNEYNPENPTGIWQYLEDRQPVWFQYGYELDDGSIEWIDGSNLFSNGKVKVDTKNNLSTVTFVAESSINNLEEYYYKGVYNPLGVSLYDLAIDVFEFANMPLLRNGVVPYVVDTALQSIITKVPLPELKIKEVLQLIANAGRCVIDCNRIGQITITRMTPSLSDFKFDFTNIKNSPLLSKSQYLLKVETFSNTVTVSEDVTQIHTSTVNLSVATQCLLKYDMSTNISLGVGTGVTVIGTPIYYAGSCLVTLVGNGTVTITGKKLIFSKDGVSYSAGLTGFVCPIENILLTSPTDAYDYAEWIASILIRRNQYNVEDRGYPELDVGDLITADTLFTKDMPSTVVSSKINFNGALSGETTFLAKDVI